MTATKAKDKQTVTGLVTCQGFYSAIAAGKRGLLGVNVNGVPVLWVSFTGNDHFSENQVIKLERSLESIIKGEVTFSYTLF